jgi:transposase-like protein
MSLDAAPAPCAVEDEPAPSLPAVHKDGFSQDLADKICDLITDGKTLREVCRMDGMPSRTTVYRWLKQHREFAEAYFIAGVMRADALFDEIDEVAESVTPETAHAAKVTIAAKQWQASKLNPRRYGDRIDANLTGGLDSNLTVRWAGDGETDPDSDLPLGAQANPALHRARALLAVIGQAEAMTQAIPIEIESKPHPSEPAPHGLPPIKAQDIEPPPPRAKGPTSDQIDWSAFIRTPTTVEPEPEPDPYA